MICTFIKINLLKLALYTHKIIEKLEVQHLMMHFQGILMWKFGQVKLDILNLWMAQ